MNRQKHFHAKQNGAALVISLIILLIMTIVGIQSMESTSLEEKMSGNFRDRTIAFQSAEAGLAAAEVYMSLYAERPLPEDTPEIWEYGALDFSQAETWQNAIENNIGITGDDQLWSSPPRYFIEERGSTNVDVDIGKGGAEAGGDAAIGSDTAQVWIYRFTAIGFGASQNSRVILQANFEKVYEQ